MTTPNRITIFRILLIPVFVLLAFYYGDSVRDGHPETALRWAAIATFVLAAASDGLDGYLARRLAQQTRLGEILDPLTDKGLVIAALIALSVSHWSLEQPIPLWFPVLVVTRDAINIAGAFAVQHATGRVRIKPHWTGKTATFLTLVTIGWAMLEVPVNPVYPTIIASLFVITSGTLYVREGIRQAQAYEQDQGAPSNNQPRAF